MKVTDELFFPDPPVAAYPVEDTEGGTFAPSSTLTAGQDVTLTVPREGDILGISLRLDGELATGATPGTPAPQARAPIGLFGDKLSVIVGGKTEIEAHPDLLLARALWRRGPLAKTELDGPTAAELADDNASPNPDFSIELPIDFHGKGIAPDHIGMLVDSEKISEVQVKFQAGSISDLMDTVGTHALSTTSFQSFVRTIRRLNLPEAVRNSGFGGYKLTEVERLIAASGVDTFVLPGQRAYSALFFRGEAGSNPVPSDSVFNVASGYIRIKRGKDTLWEKPIIDVVERTETGLAAFLAAGGSRTGWLVVDFLKDAPDLVGVFSRAWQSKVATGLTVEVGALTGTGTKYRCLTEEPQSVAGMRASRRGR